MSEKSTEKAVTRHSGKKLKVFGKLLHKKARDGKMSMVSHLDEFRKRLTAVSYTHLDVYKRQAYG